MFAQSVSEGIYGRVLPGASLGLASRGSVSPSRVAPAGGLQSDDGASMAGVGGAAAGEGGGAAGGSGGGDGPPPLRLLRRSASTQRAAAEGRDAQRDSGEDAPQPQLRRSERQHQMGANVADVDPGAGLPTGINALDLLWRSVVWSMRPTLMG